MAKDFIEQQLNIILQSIGADKAAAEIKRVEVATKQAELAAKKVGDTSKKAWGEVAKAVSKVGSASKNMITKGLKTTIDYNKSMLEAAASVRTFGIGLTKLESIIQKTAKETYLTRKETTSLFKLYGQSMSFPSLTGFNKMMVRIKGAVGSNSEAMKDHLSIMTSLSDKYSEFARNIENMGGGDIEGKLKRLGTLYRHREMSSDEYRKATAVVMGSGGSGTAEDRKKRGRLEGNIETAGAYSRGLEKIDIVIGEQILPKVEKIVKLMEKMSDSDVVNNNKGKIAGGVVGGAIAGQGISMGTSILSTIASFKALGASKNVLAAAKAAKAAPAVVKGVGMLNAPGYLGVGGAGAATTGAATTAGTAAAGTGIAAVAIPAAVILAGVLAGLELGDVGISDFYKIHKSKADFSKVEKSAADLGDNIYNVDTSGMSRSERIKSKEEWNQKKAEVKEEKKVVEEVAKEEAIQRRILDELKAMSDVYKEHSQLLDEVTEAAAISGSTEDRKAFNKTLDDNLGLLEKKEDYLKQIQSEQKSGMATEIQGLLNTDILTKKEREILIAKQKEGKETVIIGKELQLQIPIASQLAGIEKEKLKVSLKVLELRKYSRKVAQNEADLAGKLVQLADNYAIGVGASMELRMREYDSLTKVAEQHEMDLQQIRNRISLEGDNLALRAEELEIEKKIVDVTLQQAASVKSMRSGWIEAVAAMNTGAGVFSEIIMSAEKGTAQAARLSGIVSSPYSGAYGAGAGYGTSEKFSAYQQFNIGGRRGGERWQDPYAMHGGEGAIKDLESGNRGSLLNRMRGQSRSATRGGGGQAVFGGNQYNRETYIENSKPISQAELNNWGNKMVREFMDSTSKIVTDAFSYNA